MADIIDVVAKDWRYTSQQIREAVDHALIQGAVDGVTSINHARPHLPAWATGPQVGARVATHVRAKRLVWTGEYSTQNNPKHRHAVTPCKTYKIQGQL